MMMKLYNYLFIGCAYSDNQKSYFLENSIRGYQYAAQNFQEALIDGFSSNCINSFSILSIPSLSTFPNGCKSPIIKDSDFYYRDKVIGKSYGFFNVPFLNHCSQSRIDKHIDNWYNRHSGNMCIIVYGLLRQQMQYAVAAKKRHPDIQLCLVIPDLPLYMNCNKYYKMLGLQKRDMDAIDSLVHIFDCYVVLAKPMVDYLGIANKPYTVVEGIYSNIGEKSADRIIPEHKTIMYAGGIQSRYGVFDLIEAFHCIKDEDYRLILCGGCLEMDKLNSYLQKDERIKYLGVIPSEQARSMQKEVSLLVNPRHSTEDFTKYSFPSKTMEYMASGTPVLMTPLPSMPEDYKEHVFLFDDESVVGMSKKLWEVLNMNEEILNNKGKKAQQFIFENKNSSIQVGKIHNLICSIQ